MPDEDFGPYMELVEDNGTPVVGVRGVMYMTAEGKTETRWDYSGEQVWIGTFCGLLDTIKHLILHEAEDGD